MADDYEEEEEEEEKFLVLPKPSDWLIKMICFQSDLLHNCLLSLLSPIFFLLSLAWASYREAEETTNSLKMAVYRAPSKLTRTSSMVLKKIVYGCVGAVKMCSVLVGLVVLATMVGVGLVRVLLVQEPVFVRDKVWFNYGEANPMAVFSFSHDLYGKRSINGVPVGHTIHVSMLLLMPESDFNRQVGMFQVNAEILSSKGDVLAKSSQPCMLKFRSLPIRLTRTFFMGIPLLLGFSSETQLTTLHILRHKEGKLRTNAVRVTMVPRAGTSSLPQLYEAQIIINSQLPWTRQLLHNWKWTLYVWTSLYIYIIFLLLYLFFCKPFSSPQQVITSEESKSIRNRVRDESEISEFIRKWRGTKMNYERKSSVPDQSLASSAASSMVVEEVADSSESVCL